MIKNKIEIARIIFIATLSIMKKCLDIGEYKLDAKSFTYYKKEVMDFTYSGLKLLFKQLNDASIIERCPKNCSLRRGFQDCNCSGSGYINKK